MFELAVATSDRDQMPAISLDQLNELTHLKRHGMELASRHRQDLL